MMVSATANGGKMGTSAYKLIGLPTVSCGGGGGEPIMLWTPMLDAATIHSADVLRGSPKFDLFVFEAPPLVEKNGYIFDSNPINVRPRLIKPC